MMLNTINSTGLSRLIHVPISSEPDIEEMIQASLNGEFIGNSYYHAMPIFIDFDKAVNPHILICGMTGSGKTFFAKTLVTRLALSSIVNIAIIDFTGEYESLAADFPKINENKITDLFEGQGILYLNLQDLPEKEKINKASNILNRIADEMRRISSDKKVFILLDEAWKLIRDNSGLEIIIREGRKYKVGLITSSQMLNDASSTIISNIATIFLFRTTNKQNLDAISKSYNLKENDTYFIQNLNQGSCFLISIQKSGARHAFGIKKVVGISKPNVIFISGNKMEIKISITELESRINASCRLDKPTTQQILQGRQTIELHVLIQKLLESRAQRHSILKMLEHIGFKPSDIADSFALALNTVSDTYAQKQ